MPSFEVKSIRIIYPDTYVIQEGLNSLKTELISGRTQFETGRAPPWHAVLQDMGCAAGASCAQTTAGAFSIRLFCHFHSQILHLLTLLLWASEFASGENIGRSYDNCHPDCYCRRLSC